MVNLTEGIDIKGFAKCHRSLRLKDESMPTVGSNSFVGSTNMSHRDVEAVVKRLRGGVCPAAQSSVAGLGYGVQALVTTRGVRFTPIPSGNHGRERLSLDCRSIHDPDASNHLRGHLGSHCETLRGVAGQRATRDLMEAVRDFLNTNGDKMVWIDFYCTSGRHRSVASSVLARIFLMQKKVSFVTVHLDGSHWQTMACGGRCGQCQMVDLQATLNSSRQLFGNLTVRDLIQPDEVRSVVPSPSRRPEADRAAAPSLSPARPREGETEGSLVPLVQQLTNTVENLTKQLQDLQRQQEYRETRRGRSRSPQRKHPWRPHSPDHPPPPRPRSSDHPPPRRPMPPETPSHPTPRRPTSPDGPPRSSASRPDSDLPFNVTFDAARADLEDVNRLASAHDHDWCTWLGSDGPSQNLTHGVRVNIKIRGQVYDDRIKVPDSMSSWRKTSWCRDRENPSSGWHLVQQDVPIRQCRGLPRPDGANDIVVFAQPMIVEKRRVRRMPPNPLKPRRNVVWEDKLDDCPPAVVLKGRSKRVCEPDVGSTPDSKHKDDRVESPINQTSDTRSPTTEASTEAPGEVSDDSSSFQVAGYMAIGEDAESITSHKTTMNRKQKKQFAEGLEAYNHHEWAVGVNYGFRDENFTGANCSIVTSHPQIFWHQDNFNVYDVGKNADHLDQNEKAWDPIFQDVDLVVVAIAYDDPDVVLGHRDLLHELETFADVAGLKFLHIDIINTDRWNQHATPQTPYMCESGELGFSTNDEDLANRFLRWANDKTMDDVLGSDFAEWMWFTSEELALSDMMNTAFPAAVLEEETDDHATFDGVLGRDDVGKIGPREEMLSEKVLLDEVNIPGLPEDEKKRRSEWRKLPQRVRIGIRRLHRQFGHVPKGTMLQLLRAARVNPEFIKACKLHRCVACESTARKKPTHKVTMPTEFRFGHTLGIDLLEIRDAQGDKYQVLNMVDIGTTFQLVAVVKKGAGQRSSAECLRILTERWFSWAGLPEQITCDRGLHNRGTLQRYMDEHGVRVVHAPLESPESIGRTERHGGLVKALYRKVSAEVHPTSKEQVEQVLIEVTRVKNSTSRIGGFSPAQWVLGRDSRTAPSQFSQLWADLGAIEAQADPDSIFALQHQARVEARKAFAHLDCSRRVQKALLRNAQPIPANKVVPSV